jgi:hypothetical protein
VLASIARQRFREARLSAESTRGSPPGVGSGLSLIHLLVISGLDGRNSRKLKEISGSAIQPLTAMTRIGTWAVSNRLVG